MEIRYNSFYTNKTWKFLAPCLKTYGDAFKKGYSSLFKLAVGLYDYNLVGTGAFSDRYIFTLVDTGIKTKEFQTFMTSFSSSEYFEACYSIGVDVTKSRKQMLVLKLPPNFEIAYDNFLNGSYSEMYDQKCLDIFFTEGMPNNHDDKEFVKKKITYEILSKTGHTARRKFKKDIEEHFGYNPGEHELDSREWDFPLLLEEEVFNVPAYTFPRYLTSDYFYQKLIN